MDKNEVKFEIELLKGLKDFSLFFGWDLSELLPGNLNCKESC